MKNVSGLSLLEVLLAVLIVGVSVTTLLSLQGVLSRGVFTAHALIERIPSIRNFFVEADKEKFYQAGKAHTKTSEFPALTLRYTAAKPTSKKLQNFSNLLLETVQAEWPTVFGVRTETFAMTRFAVPQEKKSEIGV